jgi:opacity protein-like surface antigen
MHISLFRKIAIVLALTGITATGAMAQHSLQFNFNYNVNFPAGADFKTLADKPAFKGFTAGLAYPVMDQLRIGLSFGYNDYYQKYPRQVYSNGPGSDISAVVSNSIQQLPLLVTVDYTLLKKGFIRPYVGAGAGVNFISFDQYLGEFDNPVSYTKLAVRGEAGILIPLSNYSSTALRIGGSYNYAPFKELGVNNLSNWGVHAGISVPLH